MTRDGTAEPVFRGQILRRERGQGNIHFPCSANHEQDWQPYQVGIFSAICDVYCFSVLVIFGNLLHIFSQVLGLSPGLFFVLYPILGYSL